MSGSSYLDLVDVRGCSSGGSIPGRDEPSRGCDISVRILMVILGDLSRGNSKYTTSSGQIRALLRFLNKS